MPLRLWLPHKNGYQRATSGMTPVILHTFVGPIAPAVLGLVQAGQDRILTFGAGGAG